MLLIALELNAIGVSNLNDEAPPMIAPVLQNLMTLQSAINGECSLYPVSREIVVSLECRGLMLIKLDVIGMTLNNVELSLLWTD
jgi:hypothetical protein